MARPGSSNGGDDSSKGGNPEPRDVATGSPGADPNARQELNRPASSDGSPGGDPNARQELKSPTSGAASPGADPDARERLRGPASSEGGGAPDSESPPSSSSGPSSSPPSSGGGSTLDEPNEPQPPSSGGGSGLDEPNEPQEPSTPEGPSGPATPDGPSGPETPDGPSGPETPDGPSGPETPDGPSGPATPEEPSGPATPEGPGNILDPEPPSDPGPSIPYVPEPPGPTGPTGPAGPEALPSTPPANGPWPSHAVSLTTPPAAVGTSQSDAEKYWEIEVPDFDRATVTQPGSHGTTKDQPLSSYLRLGTAESFSGSESADYQRRRGKDLADKVQGFVDDERYRGEQGSDTYGTWTKEQRKAESALLHTKGGWRDHSDGNRVSTTRGDKVEVIRGDYKLVVLGRELGDHEDYAGAEYEMAGGMILDGDEAPGSVTKISWNKEGDTWRVIEETTKGDVISRYHGDVVEEFYGDTVTSITGAPVPGGSIAVTPKPADDAPEAEWAAWHAVNDESGSHPDGREAIAHGGKWDNHDITKNPAILEKTWAKSIESYTGSETSRIPTIKERVWAVDIDEEVHSENLRSVTRVKTMRDEVTAVGVNQMLLVGGGLADTTIATTAVETIIHGVFVEIELTGAALELSLYGAKTEIEIGGPKLDIHLGPVFEIEIPDAKDLTMSSTELSLEQKVAALQTKTATLERTTCSINTRIAGMVSVGSP